MPSPFPGMNPYLETQDAWRSFHNQFFTPAIQQLAPQIGRRYFLKAESHIYIHELSEEEDKLLGYADIGIGHSRAPSPRAANGSGVMMASRTVVLPATGKEEIPFIEIRDRESRRLVTVIELLSPSNKRPGPDRQQYVQKRRQILASSTNLVEIDLLRGYQRMPHLEDVHSDYCIFVSCYAKWPNADVWTFDLRQPIPPAPVPLEPGESDAVLDCQSILHQLHDGSALDRFIYDSEPEPPLSPEDAAWARGLMAAR